MSARNDRSVSRPRCDRERVFRFAIGSGGAELDHGKFDDLGRAYEEAHNLEQIRGYQVGVFELVAGEWKAIAARRRAVEGVDVSGAEVIPVELAELRKLATRFAAGDDDRSVYAYAALDRLVAVLDGWEPSASVLLLRSLGIPARAARPSVRSMWTPGPFNSPAVLDVFAQGHACDRLVTQAKRDGVPAEPWAGTSEQHLVRSLERATKAEWAEGRRFRIARIGSNAGLPEEILPHTDDLAAARKAARVVYGEEGGAFERGAAGGDWEQVPDADDAPDVKLDLRPRVEPADPALDALLPHAVAAEVARMGCAEPVERRALAPFARAATEEIARMPRIRTCDVCGEFTMDGICSRGRGPLGARCPGLDPAQLRCMRPVGHLGEHEGQVSK